MLTDGIESMGRSVAEGDNQGRSYMLKSSPEETCRGRAVSPRDYEPGGRSVSVAMSIHKCSVPPASPHRVGHYSGFHPEDQPYESMMMVAQPVLEHVRAAKPDSLARSKRMLSVVENVGSPLEDEQDSLVVVPLRAPFLERAYAPERKELRKPKRFVPVALIISILFFLMASSLLTYILMHRKPLAEKQVLSVVPKLMVTMGVKEAPPASLTVSPAALTYVGTMTQDPGDQLITLQNSGGQAVDWSSSIGNSAAWLSISPTHDHLAAYGSETVAVSVHAQQMAVGSYQGMINLSGGANPQVTVNLTVIAPGKVIASPPSLTFAASGQSTLSQPLAIQNSGSEPADWTVSAVTADGANWLNPAPTSGHLEVSQSATITVGVNAATLNPHAYQGMLTFKYGGVTTQVTVALTVSIPPAAAISLNRSTLSFTTIKGANPTAQQFTITNSGNATLNWSVAEDQNGKTFVPVSPSSGSLAPTKSTAITISPSVSQANGGTLDATITIFDSDVGTKVVGQKVDVSIVMTDQAVIGVSTKALPTFAHTSQLTSSSQTLTITNTGSQPLSWTVHSDATWLSFDLTSGTLNPGASAVVTVTCDSSTLTTGTSSASIVVSDSDTGTQVATQPVAVQLVVS